MIETKNRQIIQALFTIGKKLLIHVIQLDFSRANSKLLHLSQIVLSLVYSTYQSLHLISLSQEIK